VTVFLIGSSAAVPHSHSLQTVFFQFSSSFLYSSLSNEEGDMLQKLTKLQGLRGVRLDDCQENWSALTKIPSLRFLTTRGFYDGPLDCSPFLKALSGYTVRLPPVLEWKRSDLDSKSKSKSKSTDDDNGWNEFQLIKISMGGLTVDDAVFESLSSEKHLQELQLPSFSPTFVRVLPSCSSLRSLNFSSLSSNEELQLLSEALLQAPFITSLTLLYLSFVDLSPLPLASLTSFTLHGSVTLESLSRALARSKPKSLTHLDLTCLAVNGFERFAVAILQCPSLTHFAFSEYKRCEQDILPLVQSLHHFPLVALTLIVEKFTDEAIETLLSFLSRSAVQDLKLGSLSPTQLQLLADALPSLSSLLTLEFNTSSFSLCEHEISHLALFSALASSSLRSLVLNSCSFRLATLDTCLNKLPDTQLTLLRLRHVTVYAAGFDPSLHSHSYKKADLRDSMDWAVRFPTITDRFCVLLYSASSL
jgi:hypothetical protein